MMNGMDDLDIHDGIPLAHTALSAYTKDEVLTVTETFLAEITFADLIRVDPWKKRLCISVGDVRVLILELHGDRTYVTDVRGNVSTLRLFGIYVHPDYQKQGIASGVISLLEVRSTDLLRVLVIGPLFSDKMCRLLDTRGRYQMANVMDAYYNNTSFTYATRHTYVTTYTFTAEEIRMAELLTAIELHAAEVS